MRSIRSKIMWLLFCSVLISSILIGATGIGLTATVIKENSTENMNLLCKNNADKIDIVFAKIEESVNTLVHYTESELQNIELLKDDDARQAFTSEIQKNALHHIESTAGAAAVYMIYESDYIGKTDGFFYDKQNENDDFTYHHVSDSTAEDNAYAAIYFPIINGEATWFEAYYADSFDRYVMSYVVPLYKDGRLVGVIGADIFADHIANLVKEISIYDSGKGAVLKSDGTVIYHPNFKRDELIGEGDPGFDGVIDKLTAEDITKELISYELKGEKKQLACCKLRNDMLMVCFAPESEIYQKQITLTITTIVCTVIVAVVALLIALLVSIRLARPIKELNEAAKHLTDGDFDFEIKPTTYDEIGELTKTFVETRKILLSQIHLLDNEAHRDGLTGVGNKSALLDKEEEINKQIALGEADFSIALFDVNKLKIANDVFGHMAGDGLLFTVANHLAAVFGADNVYRTGGDEFVVVLTGEASKNSAEKIVACADDMKLLSVEGYPECKVSCAYGCCNFDKQSDTLFSDVLHRADKQMYKNKIQTKKETYPWQEGSKGIKQLQIEKYCELLQTLKQSTDDALCLMNLETGYFRLFGEKNLEFSVADDENVSTGFKEILKFVHDNDRDFVKDAIHSLENRDVEELDINFRMCSGDIMRWVNCRGNVIKDDLGGHFVWIGRISENAVKHLYNPLTSLFNKTKLKADLNGDTANKFNNLMLIDINNLSEINLKYGSVCGDGLLKLLAEELESRFSMWQIYHAEKDRFVVLLDIDSKEKIKNIFNEIQLQFGDKCSILASVVPNDIDAKNIYDYAVQMLNNAKREGKEKLVFLSKDDLGEKISQVELLNELEESVKNGCEGFHLVYQPQISVDDYSLVSAEALLRYNSKTRGQIYPDKFIPLLEHTGLINEVGVWVADEALRQCKLWRKYSPDFKISVNISPKQLESKSTAVRITNLLTKHELPGEALILEITESSKLDESENMLLVLARFHHAGIQIAIDDFGTGYSNLDILKNIHANIIKVDRVFIKDIKENGYNYNLIHNVLGFAKSNSLKVCLEGVETTEEHIVLSSLRPDFFQGYLFDRPVAANVIETKYFIETSNEYIERMEHIKQLMKEKKHAPVIGMETKQILRGLDVGLWIIRVNTKTGVGELYTDEIMKKLMGVDNSVTPQECYSHWEERIVAEHRCLVDEMISEMTNDDKVVQAEYLWKHPYDGEKLVRCSGRCSEKAGEFIVYEGFHRVLGDF